MAAGATIDPSSPADPRRSSFSEPLSPGSAALYAGRYSCSASLRSELSEPTVSPEENPNWWVAVPCFKFSLLACGCWRLQDLEEMSSDPPFHKLLYKLRHLLLYLANLNWILINAAYLFVFTDHPSYHPILDNAQISPIIVSFFIFNSLQFYPVWKLRRLLDARIEPHFRHSLMSAVLSEAERGKIHFYSKLAMWFSVVCTIVFLAQLFPYFVKASWLFAADPATVAYWDGKGLGYRLMDSYMLIATSVGMYCLFSQLNATFISLPVIISVLSRAELRLLALNVSDVIERDKEGEGAKEKAEHLSELFGAQKVRTKKTGQGMGIYFAMQLAGITSWWTGMMFGIGLALDVDERASLYSQVGLVLLSATLLFGSSTWFVLTSLAVAHDCWKEMKADLLDIVLLLRAEEVGLGCEIYEIFIQTNSNLGFHLCGFLIDTPTVTSFISFLLIVVLGIVVEVV
ncbi:hypothetical protein TeGR_g10267 [Tetraparma gracilis]|uniref:Gustatory receptor n=1 Tax=Tetraparma gracilis TaxID=2962635 RepID=A0ABQ6N6G8_9STRA|nr:hypothetical protein TeGR_g10267 [Tetraparma gracilis]